MVKTQPGYYRVMLGDFEVTALNDGVVEYPAHRVLPTATPQQIRTALTAAGVTDPVGMSYNAFLINTGGKLVLIDTGTGGKLDDEPEFHGAGHLMTNLRAAGYEPEQIDEIYITHRGQDHIGGLTVGSERAFINATVRAPKSEFEIFLDSAKAAALVARADNNEQVRKWIQFTKDQFEPYIQAGRFQSFDADVPLIPGIRAIATHGHTPGHTSYVVESRGQTLVVMGDLVLMGELQFADPSLASSFDADAKAASGQRIRMMSSAAANHWWICGSHLAFPGIGHVRVEKGGFFWMPVTYSIPRR
jgi:glyoxylase-like metal-dependent hydrolase (beta-lactamase superfamily II)